MVSPPAATDIGIGAVEGRTKIPNIPGDCLAFQLMRFIKVTSSSKRAMSPPRPCLCAQDAQYFYVHDRFLVRTDRLETDPDPSGTPHKVSLRQSQNKKGTFTL